MAPEYWHLIFLVGGSVVGWLLRHNTAVPSPASASPAPTTAPAAGSSSRLGSVVLQKLEAAADGLAHQLLDGLAQRVVQAGQPTAPVAPAAPAAAPKAA